MIPEQIWDAPDLREQELCFGQPSGSAMPLVWAHAEYVKLRRSLQDHRIFDMPPQTVQRYVVQNADSPYAVWCFNNKTESIPAGKTLRLESLAAAVVHWSADGWRTVHNTETRDIDLGVYVADLPIAKLPVSTVLHFTFYWPTAGRWEGADFTVEVTTPSEQHR